MNSIGRNYICLLLIGIAVFESRSGEARKIPDKMPWSLAVSGGLSFWPITSSTFNDYIAQLATAMGTSGGELSGHAFAPQVGVRGSAPLPPPLGRLHLDVHGLWASQAPSNAATEFSLTTWAIELSPKWSFLSLGSWGQVVVGGTLTRAFMNGTLQVANTSHQLQFTASTWAWGALAGLEVHILPRLMLVGLGGYHFLGRTAPVRLTQVSGQLFEGLKVDEELELTEIGVQTRRVTLTTVGPWTQLSLIMEL